MVLIYLGQNEYLLADKFMFWVEFNIDHEIEHRVPLKYFDVQL